MGGHSAWRKRVARGELAKGMGGAIMRHRPRWGPKGKEAIARQRRGYNNPKRRKRIVSADKVKEERGTFNFQRFCVLFWERYSNILPICLATFVVGLFTHGVLLLSSSASPWSMSEHNEERRR